MVSARSSKIAKENTDSDSLDGHLQLRHDSVGALAWVDTFQQWYTDGNSLCSQWKFKTQDYPEYLRSLGGERWRGG